MPCVIIKIGERHRDTHTHRGKCHMKTQAHRMKRSCDDESRVWSYAATSQCQGLLATTQS